MAAVDVEAVGEHRWPMALAVLVAMCLTFVVPHGLRIGPSWVTALVEGILLVALVVGDPGRIDRRSRWLRWLSIALVAVLLLTALSFTVQLIDDLVHGAQETESASDLLRAGAAVWISNNIAFALLYWELDGGGAAARAHGTQQLHFGFPQQMSPELGWVGWRPRFVDYLYLGFTNATAFSPTDAMPLAPWAKMAMLLQSVVSLAILSLVIANAVNLFA